MHRLAHFGVLANLLLSFAQAPFRHAHLSDPHHEHAQGFTHTHWKADPKAAAWQADDHASEARMIDWLAGDGSAPAKIAVELPSAANCVLVRQGVRVLKPHHALFVRAHSTSSRVK